MKALLQRVSSASVRIDGMIRGSIEAGILALVGFGHRDTEEDLRWMARKVRELRIFPDGRGNMNLSLEDIGGELLVVSQFTLHASTRKGRRPSFVGAAPPGRAEMLYGLFVQMCREGGLTVRQGVFGAMMEVELVNDGPVTVMVDSPSERSGG
jgi:D-tyrosyl-tRNA(Tyr) deacylase